MVSGFLDDIFPGLADFLLITVAISFIVSNIYFYKSKKYNPKKKKIAGICKKIHEELKDSIESLDGTLNRKTQQHEINDKKINYKHIYMNHKTFDSYVNSGDFTQINEELQQPIQDIYGKIDIHDEYVKKISIVGNDLVDNDVLILNQYEKELKKEIPTTMKKLKKYF